MHEQRGTIGHRRVEIAARGMEADQTVVVADGTDPRADRRVDGGGGEGALQIGHRARLAAIRPQRLEGADREVVVGVHEARHDGASLEIDHLVLVLAQPQHLVGAADLDDAPVLDREGLCDGQARIQREDRGVDKEADHRPAATTARARPRSETMRAWPMCAPSAR